MSNPKSALILGLEYVVVNIHSVLPGACSCPRGAGTLSGPSRVHTLLAQVQPQCLCLTRHRHMHGVSVELVPSLTPAQLLP
jgi:hypothetical protein